MASPSGAAVNAAKKWAVPQSDTKVSIPDGDGPSGRLPIEVERNVIGLPDGMRIEGDSPHIIVSNSLRGIWALEVRGANQAPQEMAAMNGDPLRPILKSCL
jgi:hypothetical protein